LNINAIIVDDEPHAREGLKIRLEEYPSINVVKECSSGFEAIEQINLLKPSLVFLDIQMPEMNGFEVLEKITIDPLPLIIFVTAYDKYALKAFECHAFDYLLKPISDERFEKTMRVVTSEMNRRNLEEYAAKLKSVVNDYLNTVAGESYKKEKSESAEKTFITRLMIKSKEHLSFILIDEIDWIESAGDYVYIHTNSNKYIIRETMVSLEEKLNPKNFIRIHRSAIVNVDKIKSLKPNEHGDYEVFLHSGARLKLSRTYRSKFNEVIGNTF
jgi:two-component system LytT family response regulator